MEARQYRTDIRCEECDRVVGQAIRNVFSGTVVLSAPAPLDEAVDELIQRHESESHNVTPIRKAE